MQKKIKLKFFIGFSTEESKIDSQLTLRSRALTLWQHAIPASPNYQTPAQCLLRPSAMQYQPLVEEHTTTVKGGELFFVATQPAGATVAKRPKIKSGEYDRIVNWIQSFFVTW